MSPAYGAGMEPKLSTGDVERAYRLMHQHLDGEPMTDAEASYVSRVLALVLRERGSSGGQALDSADPFEGHDVDGGGVRGVDWS